MSETLRLIVMGTGGVGKSAISGRFVKEEWVEKYDPTIEDMHRHTCFHEGKAVPLEILDTAGQEAFSSLRETFIKTGHGFMLVYAIDDDQSFEDLQAIADLIKENNQGRDIPFVLVGNKKDLHENRCVSEAEAEEFASGLSNLYTEVSAKDDDGVKEAFATLIKAAVEANDQDFSKSQGSVMGAGVTKPEEVQVVEQTPVVKKEAPKKRKGCNIL